MSIDGVVFDEQQPHTTSNGSGRPVLRSGQSGRRIAVRTGGPAVVICPLQSNAHRKRRPGFRSAFDGEVSAHLTGQVTADREAETRAPVLAADIARSLHEGREDLLERVSSNSDAGVFHRN